MTTETADLFDLDDLLSDVAVENEPAKRGEQVEVKSADVPAAAQTRLRSRCPANTLFFDLETIPDYSRESLFGLGDLPQLPPETSIDLLMPAEQFITQDLAACKQTIAGKNLPVAWSEQVRAAELASKKPRKGMLDLLDECADLKNQVAKAVEERRKTMSVTPEFCRIVSFGWTMSDDPSQCSTFGEKGGTKDHDTYEKSVLKKFWEQAKQAKVIVGYNHVGFDLPVIYVRSAMLGVTPTRHIDLKPWGGECVDLMAARWPRGGSKKLKDLARILGFDIPAGDVDGSQVEELLKTNPAKLAEYNRSDVSITREVYLMYRGLFW